MEGNNGRISVNPSRSNSKMTKTLFITFDEKWLASSAGVFTVDIPPDKYAPVSFRFYTKTEYILENLYICWGNVFYSKKVCKI